VAHLDPTAPIYVICKSGARAQKAIAKLHGAGYKHLVNVQGGTDAWGSAGLPMVRNGGTAISLPRQVQIAAGSLVLFGILIGLLHPAGFALSGFVGAGLVFSGVTDTCAMAGVLGRMPWNRVSVGSCALPESRT
jgi:rhodanese-related sulfurtransferase